jgi:hypothetical protein
MYEKNTYLKALYQVQLLLSVEKNYWSIAFGELEWSGKEAVIAWFKVLSFIPLVD